MSRYLLDTNILSDLIRNPSGRVARKVREIGQGNVCTSIIVAAELQFGAIHRRSERLSSRVRDLLASIEVLPLDVPADRTFGTVRASLEANATPIGGFDLLIASHALTLDFTLVTANVREYRRVEGLRLENWLD